MNVQILMLLNQLCLGNISFTVTSAFRTPITNKVAGGVPTSQHLTGDAIDIAPVNISLNSFVKYIDSLCLPYDQYIIYPERGFVHLSFANPSKTPRYMKFKK